MIEWMQTHRKWLVITIWVATIAFIGAGFVGWGQFQFGRKADEIARVGDIPVTIQDVQKEYNDLFDSFNKALGGRLDDAMAKKMGLDKLAINRAIQKALLRAYAKDLGLYVTDEEVAKEILKIFKSKQEYKKYLKANNLKAAEFEKSLKKDLLIQKLLTLLNIKPSKEEILTIASSLFNSDNVKIKILKKPKVKLTEDEVKKYWQKHKNEFLSNEKYKIAYIIIPLNQKVDEELLKEFYEKNKLNYKDKNGKILPFEKAKDKVLVDYLAKKLKKEAILEYKKLKTLKTKYKEAVVELNNNLIPPNEMQELIKNKILKPKVINNSYIIAKLLKTIKPQPLPYKKAKDLVAKILQEKKAKEELIKRAKKLVNNGFDAKELGFITKYDVQKIPLNPILAQEFLFEMFKSTKKRDFVLLPKNAPEVAVVYEILEQRLLEKEKYKEHKKEVKELTKNLLDEELLQDLIAYLYTKYKIVKFIKD